jgi:hypothetical protein
LGVGGSVAAWLGGPVAGGLTVGLLMLPLPVQAVRIAVRNQCRAGSFLTALAYGVLTIIGKFFQVSGQCLLLRDRFAGRHTRLIEYKFTPPVKDGIDSGKVRVLDA